MISDRAKTFVRHNWLLLSVLAGALIVSGWFAFKFISAFIFFNDPRNQDGDLRAWMNPHFVMEMYDLPREVVLDILELPPDLKGGKRLGEIGRERGLTMPELTELVRDGAAEYREQQQ